MPELNLSMANFQFAMDPAGSIKGASMVKPDQPLQPPARPDSGTSNSGSVTEQPREQTRPEPFRKVLERAESRHAPDSRQTGAEKSQDSQTVSGSDGNRSGERMETVSEDSVVASQRTDSDDEAALAEGMPDSQDNAASVASSIESAYTVSQVPVMVMLPDLSMALFQDIPQQAIPEVAATQVPTELSVPGNVPGAGLPVFPESFINTTPEPLAMPVTPVTNAQQVVADENFISREFVTGILRELPDIPRGTVQPVPMPEFSPAREFTEPSRVQSPVQQLLVAARLAVTPEVQVPRSAPGPEWTGLLEFQELLDRPTLRHDVNAERLAAPRQEPQYRSADWESRQISRFSSENSRISVQSFADRTPATVPRAESVSILAFYTSGQPVTPIANEPLAVYAENALYGITRTISDSSPQLSPSGTAAETVSAAPGHARPQDIYPFFRVSPQRLTDEVREVMIRLMSDGKGQARIVLHPPELGEIVVRLESARNGVMRAEFTTSSPLVREALEAGLSRLTEALKSEGLTLLNAEVNIDLRLGAEGSDGSVESNAGDVFESRAGDGDLVAETVRETFDRGSFLPEGATISVFA